MSEHLPKENVNQSLGNNWYVICKHLLTKPQTETWNEVRGYTGRIQGFLCNDCNEIGADKVKLDVLEPVSIESAMMLRGSRQ